MYPSICRKPLFDNTGVGMDYETIEDEDARNNNSTINIHKQNQINKVQRFISCFKNQMLKWLIIVLLHKKSC